MIPQPHRMRKRREFLLAAREGRRFVRRAVVLQILVRPRVESGLRIGLTATRKIGCAVVRNRAKRRLRAAARQVFLSPPFPQTACDIVVIARRGSTLERSYHGLVSDLGSIKAEWGTG